MSKRLLSLAFLFMLLFGNQIIADPVRDDFGFAKMDAIERNNFASDLYQHIAKTDNSNIFFSPYSISTALMSAYLGACEDTRAEMEKVLHITDVSFSQPPCKDVTVANRIFVQKDYPIRLDYMATLQYLVGTSAELIDFTNQQEACSSINAWISKETREKINELVGVTDITHQTKLVLANAIYFNGKWEKPFEAAETRYDVFYNGDQAVESLMMQQTNDFNYYGDDTLQMIELPYKDSSLSMLILLPRNYGEIKDVSPLIAEGKLTQLTKNLSPYNVTIKLPKFKLETNYQLRDLLSDMGMPLAFSPSADFSGITGNKDLYISKVIHKAFIEVGELGSEAAAATAVSMNMKCFPFMRDTAETTFNANHPFFFIIREKETNLVLFVGEVRQP